jgi:hypothetical protein
MRVNIVSFLFCCFTVLMLCRLADNLTEDVMLKVLEARRRLAALEDRLRQRDCEMAALLTELSRHSQAQESASERLLGHVARLEAKVLLCKLRPLSRWRLLRLDRFSQLSLLSRSGIL